ncbi:MAG TPA: ubiquinol-cytochrome c reductase iron-sulfur subunit [Syntrophorhabdaceae bacterium]|nr:ubiquinol-cytochrome c reductase iron-sulfur subunit [Syntrophorhabdaceae bacterium]HOT43125.1 ubiquinol-cytochrome c reductase iron-sulfur subunit [Syntrophorhabdaceae bacterium]HPC67009.1 ubiquinol-cytochrome c reductase iron-sulfur subunit [Syntrophorhabdaceae bacterium]HQE81104.1 ubiquinol-cytochrome c reductase iron-sulfur subunit [Syntrophorhabdaceae bacterium]HQH43654.1 ubiquinol-cytochrome c reductase iron-sulfur subunit [Syntrophorhabdaceae bacterium]
MKLKFSLISRRQFLNTLFGGWLIAFLSGGFYALLKFAFPTLGKEPDFVVLNAKDFIDIPTNSVKPFAWGGKLGFIFKRPDNKTVALKGVCTHMECNIAYKPEDKKFYCPCHKGWFDMDGKVLEGPPPKPLEFFEMTQEGEKLVVAKKGIKVELPKA